MMTTNAQLKTENERLRVAFREAEEQQAATSEILRVIGDSPTDAQPVFDAIVQNAVRLCGASFSVAATFDGELLRLVTHYNVDQGGADALRRAYPMRPNRGHAAGRAILDRTVVHLPDALADPDYDEAVAHAVGNRSMVSVPMLREGQPIGTITVARREPLPFSEKQIELLKTFAD